MQKLSNNINYDKISKNKQNYSINIEEEILKFWEINKIFEKSIEQRKHHKEFIFYDGPPFATGLPHYGNLLAGIIKDVIPRYKTMIGKLVHRKFGWDCHGLPVEYETEKLLNINSKKDIEKIGISNFNEKCRSIVLKYSKEWIKTTNRIGRWVDFENSYYTMNKNYMETIWWIFKKLWQKKLIYEGKKIVPYCPRCSTSLSNFEVNQGYKDIQEKAITVKFKCINRKNYYYLAWTTTPWTLYSNNALSVNKNITYLEIYDLNKDEFYVLSDSSINKYKKELSNYKIINTFKGKKIIGKRYQPIFKYFENLQSHGAFKIVSGDHVTIDNGTGIVHTATGFGEDDYNIGKINNIPMICPIDEECRFNKEIYDQNGVYVQNANEYIIKKLIESNSILKIEQITHNYPHCWRDGSKLIYRAISSWFINTEKIKTQIINVNKKINWIPNYIKNGRFGKWLENLKDWSISRNRYWGCPIPIWKNKKTNECICVGSIQELENLTNKKFNDIHKHIVDNCVINNHFIRVPEVLDCWFESGAMPYAQKHYPFENQKHFTKTHPADFIAEGIDQTRGWFYTLTVLSVALFNKTAFKNVIVNGLILDNDGQKMSKSKKNYPEPNETINKYGADSIRLFMLNSPCAKGENLKFSEKEILENIKTIILPMWNAYVFFITYAKIDNWKPRKTFPNKINVDNPLDKWILSKLYSTYINIKNNIDKYDIQKSIIYASKFLDYLNNWYIRCNRRRFWKYQNDKDKNLAYDTLYYTLINLIKIMCPIIPFITEKIYQNIKTDNSPLSIHLCKYPIINSNLKNHELEIQMESVISIINLGRQIRMNNKIKNRQPLECAYIISENETIIKNAKTMHNMIKKELNVKNIEFQIHETNITDTTIKPNFKNLGAKFQSKTKEISSLINNIGKNQIDDLIQNKNIKLTLKDTTIVEINQNDIIIVKNEVNGITSLSNNNLKVGIDINITHSLQQEGIAKEFINRIQNLRKKNMFKVEDKINITIMSKHNDINHALINFKSHIQEETLAMNINDILYNSALIDDMEKIDINNKNLYVQIKYIKIN